MAKRRMLSVDLMHSDEFLDLALESQLLYVHLLTDADDDGFLIGKKRILSILGLKEKAFRALTDAGFVIVFPSGAAVLTHWPLCNKIQKDRYTPTKYQAEMALLTVVPNAGYALKKEPDAVLSPEKAISPENTDKKENADAQNDGAENKSPDPDASENVRSAPEDAAPVKAETNAEPRDGEVYFRLPLSDGGEHSVTNAQAEEYGRLYPGVNVLQELRNMRGWLLSRPEKQKTAQNIERFINFWLVNALNRPKPAFDPSVVNPYTSYRKKADDWEYPPSYDMAKAEEKLLTTTPKLKKKRPR